MIFFEDGLNIRGRCGCAARWVKIAVRPVESSVGGRREGTPCAMWCETQTSWTDAPRDGTAVNSRSLSLSA